MTTTVPAVYAAISACTADLLSGIRKNGDNKAQGYRFRGIDDVYNTVAPVIARHQLLILQRVVDKRIDERATKSGGTMFYTHIEVEYDFISAVDGSRHVVSAYGEASDSGDKSTNKALSAAYKYMAIQAFCIPVKDMSDADAETPEDVRPRAKPLDLSGVENPWTPTKDALKAKLEAATTTDAIDELRASDEWTGLVKGVGVPAGWPEALVDLARKRWRELAA
jgi:hypothetical protein